MKKAFNLFSILIALIFLSPNGLFAQKESSLEIALKYLDAQKETLNLTSDDISEYHVNDLYTTKHNGVTHVYLKQKHQNIEVNEAIFNINILSDGKVLNFGNRFVSNLNEKINTTTPSIAPELAVQRVIDHFEIKTTGSIELQSRTSDLEFIFSPEGLALEPIEVELAYEVVDLETVQLVWKVRYYQLDAQHWWNARVDAVSGRFIKADDYVVRCNFETPGATCSNEEHSHDFVNHASSKTETAESMVMGNAYNVYPIPVQGPTFGARTIVTDPANLEASPFGWHDTDGMPGSEFTITRGNNAHAYQDVFNLNRSLDDEPDGGEDLEFDFPLDLSTNLPYTQIDPAITNLFYWTNIAHDLWYQYGFDEESGNFQTNNYGNGGIQGDFIAAEGLDGSGTNNAIFSAAQDGSTARIQMFLWTNEELPDPPTFDLLATAPDTIQGETYAMVPAAFGGGLNSPGITAPVVLVADGVGTSSDLCEDLTNGAEIDGAIALIDRGGCEFGEKMLKAEQGGAIAVIVCQNLPDPPFAMGAGDFGNQVTIPGVMISMANCAELKMHLEDNLTVTLESPDFNITTPGPGGIDGDFDNGIIAHEYAHGVSGRLTGGPAAPNCLNNAERPSEGWSDWFGLVMTTGINNTADERRGIGTYAINEPPTGTGIRTYPYSRSMAINPDTYANITTSQSVHRIGSVWCAMTWDLYWNLVDEYSFDEDLYNGNGGNNIAMQLVVDGLKLQSCNPTFIDSRDAILAADVANNGGANECLIWETFARRGLGFSAAAGGIEAFDLPASCVVTSTENSDQLDLLVDISPNPTDGIINVNINNIETEVMAKITSIDGKLLLSKQINPAAGNVAFDLSNYQAGIYLLNLETKGFSTVRKIVLY